MSPRSNKPVLLIQLQEIHKRKFNPTVVQKKPITLPKPKKEPLVFPQPEYY